MPRKPKRPCRYPGCPNLTDHKSSWCDEHEKKMQQHYEHFARGYNHQKRYGGSWPKVRARYLHAHPLCERCAAAGRYVKATLVHHILPLAEGGTHDEANLQALCVSCHEQIHQRAKREG